MDIIVIVAVFIVIAASLLILPLFYFAWSDRHHNGELHAVTTLDSETVLDNIVRDFVSSYWSVKDEGEDWVVLVPDFFSGQLVVRAIDREEDTEVSLLYTGESGLPYSYVYRSDLNGDGYPGAGPAFDRTNDLLWVPSSASETPVTGFATLQLLESIIGQDECLQSSRRATVGRNACRAPWQNRLDLRIAQRVPIGGADVRLEADLINVLNFVNHDWGQIRVTPSTVALLEATQRAECLGCIGDLLASWGGGVLPVRGSENVLRSAPAWVTATPASQWQVQFGARVRWR